jgi:tRNA (cytidine/uridine-2'-O-)-methyltransferase
VLRASREQHGGNVRIALYQPDIPQNTGTILRLAACLGVPVDIIGPAGFDMSGKALRRAGLDYLEHADLARHESWEAFGAWRQACEPRLPRLVLLSAHADTAYWDFGFERGDVLLFGRESGGVPEAVRESADASLTIPMRPGLRSLNLAVAVAMVVGEAVRQTRSPV